jgi:hypothetical protein
MQKYKLEVAYRPGDLRRQRLDMAGNLLLV